SRNLLKMLTFTDHLPVKEIPQALLHSENLDMLEVFIHIFAQNLNKIIKVVQIKEYQKKDEELRFLRGKLNIQKSLNPVKLHLLPCRYHRFTQDNQINRTLKFTCYLMAR